jgi:hypothetical protein
MGYAVGSLIDLGELLQSAKVAGKRVIDLGSQDVTIFDEADLQNVRKFITTFGGDPDFSHPTFNGAFPGIISARDIFSAARFEYSCCDVDRRPGTVYIDYNTLAFDQSLYGKFDLVLNAGTTEHLPNHLAAFFFMHYLCREGGLLYNEVPLSGMFNHGLNNLTPKFWHTLRWMNSYRVMLARIKKVQLSQVDDGNFGGRHLDFIENLRDIEQDSSCIQIIFQKVEDRGFIPPFDAVFPIDDGGKALADLVYASLAPFVACGSLGRDDAVASVNAFMLMQCLSHRIPIPDARKTHSWPRIPFRAFENMRATVRRLPFYKGSRAHPGLPRD